MKPDEWKISAWSVKDHKHIGGFVEYADNEN